MTRESVERSLTERSYGSAWISSSKLRKWLGVGNDAFRKFSFDLDKRVAGNRIEFFIPDVAAKILEGK